MSRREDIKTTTPKRIPAKLRQKIALCCERPSEVMFLDLETTGLSHHYDEFTLIGWSLGGKSKTVVKGHDSSEFVQDVGVSQAIVSFNGTMFDLKFIAKELPECALPHVHIDLRYLCLRVGLKGGQKAIENVLGLDFRNGVKDIDGMAAVILWHRYLRGDHAALQTLIAYNRADIAAMGAIFNEALERLAVERDLFGSEVDFTDWSAPQGWTSVPSGFEYDPTPDQRSEYYDDFFGCSAATSARIVGIDLTGSEARPSGWCLLKGKRAYTDLISTDKDLIRQTVEAEPDLISIDCPLCLPTGRTVVTDDDPGREAFGIMRQCERELKRRGVNVYPCLLPSMQKLTERGIGLATAFRKQGLPVIESYPGAAQDILRIPRKGAGVEWLQLGLSEFGISLNSQSGRSSHDELDAATSALVGTFHMSGYSEELGSLEEPPLVIPDRNARRLPFVVGISGPIAAGKTTVGRHLESRGFAYTRFSQVIDEFLDERGWPKNRLTRQKLGTELQERGRQTELAARTLIRVADAELVVVDGLRFPEDHAYFFERVGFSFLHIFIDADAEVRRARYFDRETEAAVTAEVFEEAQGAVVEANVENMRGLAQHILYNSSSLAHIEGAAHTVVDQERERLRCQFPS